MDDLVNNIIEIGFQIDINYIECMYNKYKEKNLEKEKKKDIRELWISAEREFMPMLISRLSIKVDIAINGKIYRALIDTGAEINIISKKIIEECNLYDTIDKSYKSQIFGIAGKTKTSLGFIPYLNISIGNKFETPCPFMVMDEEHIDVILCQSFLSYYKAVLDFNNNTLMIDGQKINMFICDKY